MMNVKYTPKDPLNLTEKEKEEVVELAVKAVADNFGEKISGKNLSMIRLYREPLKEHYVFGGPEYEAIDPEFLVENTQLTYQKPYGKCVREPTALAVG